jgi:hypothetical protein
LTRPGRPGGWLANQKTAGPQAICHGAWSPPPTSTWSALVHLKRVDPARPTWWLVSQSEDRGPPGDLSWRLVPPSRLYLASLARLNSSRYTRLPGLSMVYRPACASGAGGERGGKRTGLNGVEARAKAVYRLAQAHGTMEIMYRPACAPGGLGGRGREENGPERSGSARQSSVPARPSARDHGDSVPARLRVRGWGGEGGRRTGLNGVKARAKAVYRLARAREKMGGWNMSLRGTRAAFTVSTQFSRYEFHGT